MNLELAFWALLTITNVWGAACILGGGRFCSILAGFFLGLAILTQVGQALRRGQAVITTRPG